MVRTLRAELGTEHGTVQQVAIQLDYGVESVRQWVKQADIDEGHAPGVTTAEAKRIRRAGAGEPRAQARERDLEASGVLRRGGARPPTQEVVAFIDANRDEVVAGKRLRIESICATLCTAGLQVAPSTYYAAKYRARSAWAALDGELWPALRELREGEPPDLRCAGVVRDHRSLDDIHPMDTSHSSDEVGRQSANQAAM